MTDRRVAFLYAGEVSHEFRDVDLGLVPRHRVFGATDTPAGVTPIWWAWPRRWPRSLRGARVWRLVQATHVLFRRDLDAVICTTEASAPPVLALRALRMLRCRVVVVNVALLKERNASGLRGAVMRFLVSHADAIASYSRAQAVEVQRRFGVPARRSVFVPLGVDIRFFDAEPAAAAASPRTDLTLFVGTNEGKDMGTLMRAAEGVGDVLVITDDANIASARATGAPAAVRFATHVPIGELRDLYRSAARIVLALREGPVSSGQTVLLESLVSGRRPIVSDVSFIRDYAAVGHPVLVPADDAEAMHAALLTTPADLDEAELAAVRETFDVRRSAADLVALALGDSRATQE